MDRLGLSYNVGMRFKKELSLENHEEEGGFFCINPKKANFKVSGGLKLTSFQ